MGKRTEAVIAAVPKKKRFRFASLSNECRGKQETTLSSFHLLLQFSALSQYFLFSPNSPIPLCAQSIPGHH